MLRTVPARFKPNCPQHQEGHLLDLSHKEEGLDFLDKMLSPAITCQRPAEVQFPRCTCPTWVLATMWAVDGVFFWASSLSSCSPSFNMIATTITGISIQKGSSWTWIDGPDLFAAGDERFPVTEGWQTQISRQCPLVIVVNREVHFWWQPPTSDLDDSFADMWYMVLDKFVMLTSLWCWQVCDVDKFVMLTSLWCLKPSNASTTVETCYVTPLASFSTSIKVKANFFCNISFDKTQSLLCENFSHGFIFFSVTTRWMRPKGLNALLL